MGTGIVAAIPIIIGLNKNKWNPETQKEYFSNNFFENYLFDNENQYYTLNSKVLVTNYYSFILEFYDLIGETTESENIKNVNSYEEFEATFDPYARNKSYTIYGV